MVASKSTPSRLAGPSPVSLLSDLHNRSAKPPDSPSRHHPAANHRRGSTMSSKSNARKRRTWPRRRRNADTRSLRLTFLLLSIPPPLQRLPVLLPVAKEAKRRSTKLLLLPIIQSSLNKDRYPFGQHSLAYECRMGT